MEEGNVFEQHRHGDNAEIVALFSKFLLLPFILFHQHYIFVSYASLLTILRLLYFPSLILFFLIRHVFLSFSFSDPHIYFRSLAADIDISGADGSLLTFDIDCKKLPLASDMRR